METEGNIFMQNVSVLNITGVAMNYYIFLSSIVYLLCFFFISGREYESKNHNQNFRVRVREFKKVFKVQSFFNISTMKNAHDHII